MPAETNLTLGYNEPPRRRYTTAKHLALYLALALALNACTTGGNLTSDITPQTPSTVQTTSNTDMAVQTDGQNVSEQGTLDAAGSVPIPQTAPANMTADNTVPPTPVQQEPVKAQKTALFSFGRKPKADSSAPPVVDAAANTIETSPTTPQTPTTIANVESAPAQTTNTETNGQAVGTPQAIPERNAESQQKGSLMRLFGGSANPKQNKPSPDEDKVALVPLPKKDPHEYNDVLPGVRPNGGIVIKHRSSLYDDTDIDANESDSSPSYTLASVGLYGRSLPNGLKLARKDVEVACLKPQLISILKTVERRFGKPVIITSGYRSPVYNRKVNGAKRSMHMSCAAADIQVPDVNKWEVAKFVRGLPGRGGVGTYCHQSIHVDVGPKRDWNWSCSAKK
ncbi:YcbK family protein [Bartonella sp. LJL80]